MLMPFWLVAMLIEAQTFSVWARASGIEAMYSAVGGGHAFFDLGGKAAENIDADGGGGPVEALGQLDEAVPVETGADKGDGGHRNAFVDHRDAVVFC